MKTIAIIPARSSSKRIPNKNIKIINDKPLIYWTMKAAHQAKCIDFTYISTESDQYIHIFNDLIYLSGFNRMACVKRPEQYAADDSQLEEFIVPFLKEHERDNVIILQPTSPVRLQGTIDAVYDYFISSLADSVLTVGKIESFLWDEHIPNYDTNNRPKSQDYETRLYFENGSIYITKRSSLLSSKNRLSGHIHTFELKKEESFEIDDEIDFTICEALLNKLHI